ncbi:MAG: hypothetical protein RR090_12735 [Niameybacter sp.]|uniref:hypothetical protein n=1 Tax=Niameybacter sp. TaxID=2033640 RepID=UPI002FC90118
MNNKLDGEKQKSNLTFIENGNYLKFLACTPVQFKLKGASEGCPLTKVPGT